MAKPPSFLTKSIEILHEDDRYIVFNKPAGLLVVPTPKDEDNTLTKIVNFQYASNPMSLKLYPCHRLDRETSGAILFAKGVENQDCMMEEFKNHRVTKKYIAFIRGRLAHPSGELKSFIENREERKYHKRSAPKLAITRYKVMDVKKDFSVLEVEPVTGRTNQIRIQFSEIGHPLVGDRKFSFARDFDLKFRRSALHARQLEWNDSLHHKKIKVTAPLPEDMEVFLERN